MDNNSRIQNTFRNVGLASFTQIITILLTFISRTFFVKILGNDYLSCDGLFTNILTILSFSELGIGSAIIYSLYEPIAIGDKKSIGKLMNFFATAYKYIALTITILGICIIPFLKFLISDVPDIRENISVLYCLFLVNTVVSYIFGYKRSLLMADQKNYVVLLIQQGANILRVILQTVLLFITQNYILYLLISIICTMFSNIVSTVITDKTYPWLKDYCGLNLNQKEKKMIFSNVKAIIQYKFGSVILNGTDNILISTCLKTSYIGLCSNYILIINALNTIVSQSCNGVQASIGNFNVLSNNKSKHKLFEQLFFISFWILGYFTICLLVLLSPFVGDIWLGTEYVISYDVVLALCLAFYINLINIVPSMYRTTMGYFKEAKNCPLYAAVLNVILSILLSKILGLAGIFFATSISRLVTYNIIDPLYVFKKGFEINPAKHYKQLFLYTIVLIIAYLVNIFVISLFSFSGIIGFILRFIICTLITNILFGTIFFRTIVFKGTLKILANYIKRKK